MVKRITPPLTEQDIAGLKAGDEVSITGVIYVGRDAAHKRMVEALDRGEPLPFDVKGQIIYYMGPSPAKPGQVIGSAGPTTAGRMDAYATRMMAEGLKGMIGKGVRAPAVREAMKTYGAVYFAGAGGAGALMSRAIKSAEVVAYGDLGPEAILRLEVENLPLIVVNDVYGGDVYETGKAQYRTIA